VQLHSVEGAVEKSWIHTTFMFLFNKRILGPLFREFCACKTSPRRAAKSRLGFTQDEEGKEGARSKRLLINSPRKQKREERGKKSPDSPTKKKNKRRTNVAGSPDKTLPRLTRIQKSSTESTATEDSRDIIHQCIESHLQTPSVRKSFAVHPMRDESSRPLLKWY
jgi:hypothetical protein